MTASLTPAEEAKLRRDAEDWPPCDVTACDNASTWVDVGEAGDLWLCDDHHKPALAEASKDDEETQ